VTVFRLDVVAPEPVAPSMDLPAPLAWLVDEAGASPGPDLFLVELGGRLLSDGLPLAGGALTLAVPHPIIARRTWLWRAETAAVIEALGFAGGLPGDAGRGWLAQLGLVHEETIGPAANGAVLGWAGTRPFDAGEEDRLRQAARFAAAPLAGLAARSALAALLEAYLGRRSAARVQATRYAAAPAKPSALRCSVPICAASPPCPRRPSPRR
jgi:adenylate cyclase